MGIQDPRSKIQCEPAIPFESRINYLSHLSYRYRFKAHQVALVSNDLGQPQTQAILFLHAKSIPLSSA
jgi:hypothetical protein